MTNSSSAQAVQSMRSTTRRSFMQTTTDAVFSGGAAWSSLPRLTHAADGNGQLRVGHAQTPEEARAELAAIKAATADLARWEKRKAAIRRGILEGAKLANLPEKPPPDPVFFNKRIDEGYTAESVAIRSWPRSALPF